MVSREIAQDYNECNVMLRLLPGNSPTSHDVTCSIGRFNIWGVDALLHSHMCMMSPSCVNKHSCSTSVGLSEILQLICITVNPRRKMLVSTVFSRNDFQKTNKQTKNHPVPRLPPVSATSSSSFHLLKEIKLPRRWSKKWSDYSTFSPASPSSILHPSLNLQLLTSKQFSIVMILIITNVRTTSKHGTIIIIFTIFNSFKWKRHS